MRGKLGSEFETYRIATPSEENRFMARGTCIKNIVKMGRVVLELCAWTDKQTDILIAIFRAPPEGGGGEVTRPLKERAE